MTGENQVAFAVQHGEDGAENRVVARRVDIHAAGEVGGKAVELLLRRGHVVGVDVIVARECHAVHGAEKSTQSDRFFLYVYLSVRKGPTGTPDGLYRFPFGQSAQL